MAQEESLMTQWFIAPTLKTLPQSKSGWDDDYWKECVLEECPRLIDWSSAGGEAQEQ